MAGFEPGLSASEATSVPTVLQPFKQRRYVQGLKKHLTNLKPVIQLDVKLLFNNLHMFELVMKTVGNKEGVLSAFIIGTIIQNATQALSYYLPPLMITVKMTYLTATVKSGQNFVWQSSLLN